MYNDFQSSHKTFISSSLKKSETIIEAKQNKYLFIYLFILFLIVSCCWLFFGESFGS